MVHLSLHQPIWERFDRLRIENTLPHALAFTGGDEAGQLEFAWRLAQALVCIGVSSISGESSISAEKSPCGHCGPCLRVISRQSESVFFVEPTTGLIKLESAREILSFLNLQRIGPARVVLIHHAQKLNPQASNALLKVIEEPPPQTYFILIAPEISQLLPTLRSRCQVVRFSSQGVAREEVEPGLKTAAIDFFSLAFRGRRESLAVLLENAKDRESTQEVVKMLQHILRDWSVLQSAEGIHPDLAPQIAQFPDVSLDRRVALWQSAYQMELDLAAHVDKILVFENFYIKVKACN